MYKTKTKTNKSQNKNKKNTKKFFETHMVCKVYKVHFKGV